MKKIRIMIMTVAMAAGLPADLLVGFTPGIDYVPVTKSNGGVVTNGAFRYVPFSMTNPRSPSSGYSGPVFYGGVTGTVSLGSSATSWSTTHATNAAIGAVDFINAVSASGISIGAKQWAVFMFTNESASITQFVYNIRLSGSASTQSNLLRLVVQKDNGSFYISEQKNRPSTGYITNSSPASLAWYNYDPSTSLADIGSQVAGFTLDNVTAAGMWTSTEYVSGSMSTINTGLSIFETYGVPIPEPVTAGLMGLGAAVAVIIRRRCR